MQVLPSPQVTGLLSHSRRGVRAPGATETPEPPRVPRGGLPNPLYAVSGRPEPTSRPGTEAREPAPCLWARPGEGPSPQEREEPETDPRPRGCLCSTTRGAQPQGRCTVPGLPASELSSLRALPLLFFRGVRGSRQWPRASVPGVGLCLWLGSNPPWRAALRLPSPTPSGRGLAPGQAKDKARAHASPVHEWSRGSGRPETAYRGLGRPPRGTRKGGLRPKGRRTARGLWLSKPVTCGGGENLHRAPALGLSPSRG